MSQEGANLPQDVEGNSPGGAGSAASGSISSSARPATEIVIAGSKPASLVINPPKDVRGTHDGITSLVDEAMPRAVGLSGTAGSGSVKLAGEDINGGSKPVSPLVVHACEKNTVSNLAFLVVVHAAEKNNGGSKPANPAAVLGAGESNKGEEKGKLAGGDGGGGDAAGESTGVAGSSSKSIKSLSHGVIQDDIKDAPKPVAAGGGSKGKGKGAAVEADNTVHIWTERERRKKMKNMYSTLHSLLPRLPNKVDMATIVGEAVDYIKTLKDTIQKLEKLKVELMRAQQLGAGSSSVAPAPPLMRYGILAPATRETTLADMVHNWSVQQQALTRAAVAPHKLDPLQTWSSPKIALSVTGNEAFIRVCTSKQPCVLTKVLYVLEKYRIDIVTMNISSYQNQNLFYIHTRISAASARLAKNLAMTAEDRYKLAVSEMLQCIAK